MAQQFNGIQFYRLQWIAFTAVMLLITITTSCKHEIVKVVQHRTYRMGFENFPPNYTLLVQTLTLWTQRADAAIISTQVPWDSLYSGIKPENYIIENYKALVDYYRSKNFKLWIYIDPVNGLNRAADADDLAALGKSISQAPVQAVYTRFAFLMDSLLKPDHMGLALETNLVRGASSAPIYQGIKTAANSAAATIRAYDKSVKLSVSIQADYAWGLLTTSSYQGVATDFADFSFVQELGISSYPFFVFNQAQDMPANYYSRLIEGHNIPVFVSEGGWSSQTVGTYTESLKKQQDYITKQGELLDQVNAIAYFQLTFTDFPATAGTTASLFSHLGLVDTLLNAKPALTNWDQLFSKPLAAGN